MDDSKKLQVESFFKTAFCIDGEAEVLAGKEASELLKDAKLSVIRLTDSKRGTFYLATFKTQ